MAFVPGFDAGPGIFGGRDPPKKRPTKTTYVISKQQPAANATTTIIAKPGQLDTRRAASSVVGGHFVSSPPVSAPASANIPSTNPSSVADGSSRRSSVDLPLLHSHSHQASLTEESSHTRAVREAFVRKDVEELRRLSPKGFVNDAMRRLIWPLIVHAPVASPLPVIQEEQQNTGVNGNAGHKTANKDKIDEPGYVAHDEDNASHRDDLQVKLDVDRSMIHLPQDETRTRRREQLYKLITSTLQQFPSLNYFQGYHDIISVVLLVCDDDMDLAFRLTTRISLHHIRDSMLSWLGPTVGYLRLLKRVLEQADPELAKAVEKASTIPYFSLSWVLTLMAHDVTAPEVTSRIFDFLLAHNPAVVAYLSAAIVLVKKRELQELDPDIAEEPATLHTILSKLPKLSIEPHSGMHSQVMTPNTSLAAMRNAALQIKTSDRLKAAVSALEHFMDGGPATSSGMHSRSNSVSSSGFIDLVDAVESRFIGSPRRSRANTVDKPLYLQDLFAHAKHLYEQFPLDHPKIMASDIFGQRSAVFTWSQADLPDKQAEMYVQDGVDVVYPDPEEERKKLEEMEERRRIRDKERRLIRKGGKVPIYKIFDALQASGVLRSTALVMLAGFAGILMASYATRTGFNSLFPAPARSALKACIVYRQLATTLKAKQDAERDLAAVLASNSPATGTGNVTPTEESERRGRSKSNSVKEGSGGSSSGDSSPSVYSDSGRATPEPPWLS